VRLHIWPRRTGFRLISALGAANTNIIHITRQLIRLAIICICNNLHFVLVSDDHFHVSVDTVTNTGILSSYVSYALITYLTVLHIILGGPI